MQDSTVRALMEKLAKMEAESEEREESGRTAEDANTNFPTTE